MIAFIRQIDNYESTSKLLYIRPAAVYASKMKDDGAKKTRAPPFHSNLYCCLVILFDQWLTSTLHESPPEGNRHFHVDRNLDDRGAVLCECMQSFYELGFNKS